MLRRRDKSREAVKRKPDIGKNKTVHLEILRIIAIFGVFFCHTGYDGIHHYTQTDNGLNYWLGIFLVSVAQFCVPLFFMITGALLLRREETPGYVYAHRVLRVTAAAFLAVLFQYVCNCIRDPDMEFEVDTYFRLFFEGGAATPHWFLYAYLSLMFCMPFLQLMAKAVPDSRWFLYVFLTYGLINDFYPILAYYQEWGSTPLTMTLFPQSILCCILGYYVECRSEDIFHKGRNVLLLIGVSALLTAVSMHMNHLSVPEYTLAEYGGLFTWVYALTVYVAVRYLCGRRRMPGFLRKLFCFAGGGVFGTYILGEELLRLFRPVYVYLNDRIYSYIAVFVEIGVCVITGILITNLLKKIPGLGKVL